ncbi:MAG: DUF4437 domain-containing protein [Planctomycetota bacterium]
MEWTQLNPARGAASPQAGALWGERAGPGPAGFLLKPVDGFRSPPHIHGVAYRGVVISGLLHNDDPDAANMWMGVSSYWTQPAGEVHVTAAKGGDCLAYIEVDDLFDVQPASAAFDSGERALNVERDNIVWLDASSVRWVRQSAALSPSDGVRVAFLWGDPQGATPYGVLLQVPGGVRCETVGSAASFRSVVIDGALVQQRVGGPHARLEPGSYFYASKGAEHQFWCEDAEGCTVYLRADGPLELWARPR